MKCRRNQDFLLNDGGQNIDPSRLVRNIDTHSSIIKQQLGRLIKDLRSLYGNLQIQHSMDGVQR